MIIKITYNGITYESMDFPERSVEEYSDYIYDNIARFNSFRMEMPNGGLLVLSGEALRESAILVLPNK